MKQIEMKELQQTWDALLEISKNELDAIELLDIVLEQRKKYATPNQLYLLLKGGK